MPSMIDHEAMLTNAEAVNAFVSRDDRIEAVAEAQLVKVVEWLEKHNEATTYPLQSKRLMINAVDWQSLKATKEGKND